MDCGNPIKKLFCPDKRQRERYCTDSNQLSTNTQRSIDREEKEANTLSSRKSEKREQSAREQSK